MKQYRVHCTHYTQHTNTRCQAKFGCNLLLPSNNKFLYPICSCMLFSRNRTSLTCCCCWYLHRCWQRTLRSDIALKVNQAKRWIEAYNSCAYVFGMSAHTIKIWNPIICSIFIKAQNQVERQDACICVRAHFLHTQITLYWQCICMRLCWSSLVFLLICKMYGFHASQSTVPTRWLSTDKKKSPKIVLYRCSTSSTQHTK